MFSIFEEISTEQEIKKSRFKCRLTRISSTEEALEKLAKVVAENPKATHTCWAFVLGDAQEVQRYSDDGEPSGTAGVPILDVLKKMELTGVLATVTRYFGGVKLGSGGLIRAYAGSVSEAVRQARLTEKVRQQEIRLTLDYQQFDSLQNLLSARELTVFEPQFTEKVTLS
ncbi:MAG: YigZ family protein, partial [Streptococcaceae bacterium]|nr:YigZ family protein [Streptococcaceae bacterium]